MCYAKIVLSLTIFDTFEGFDDEDISYEKITPEVPVDNVEYYTDTEINIVKKRLPHPEMAVIVKGRVPDTLRGIDEGFCFVNLDMDLYLPTKEALRWFFPRMKKGGGILIHDYFNDRVFPNLRNAVIEFCSENGDISFFPIGDGFSVFIPKT